MKEAQLAELLESMPEQALSRFIRQCACQSLHQMGETPEYDVQIALDMAYAECERRGCARLYDMAYESVAQNPSVCSAA